MGVVPSPSIAFPVCRSSADLGKVLGIVYRCIATHLIRKAGCTRKLSHTGAVTLIQRFGSALNANIHFHMLFLDGVYVDDAPRSSMRFRWVKAPSSAELTQLTHTLAQRVGRFPERRGLLECDAENDYPAGEAMEAEPLDQLLGHSITYRNALGPHQGRKVFTLQSLPSCNEPFDDRVGKVAGFSLHAGVAARADECNKLERLCRYIARLAALVPKPRVNSTRFFGVFAPKSAHHARATPARRDRGSKPRDTDKGQEQTPAKRWASMSLKHCASSAYSVSMSRAARSAAAASRLPPASRTLR